METASSSAAEPQVLYMTPNHRVTKARYVTSSDPRGYVPVYEYPLNGQWIMMDTDDGYVLWTGIWKALGNSKADIVKILESQPELSNKLRRVRGGYLKMQGTWMARDVALELAKRVAWNIRYDLVPLFGPSFPDSCLSPDQPGYGKVVTRPPPRSRRSRRSSPPLPATELFDSPVESSISIVPERTYEPVEVPRERSMSHSSGQQYAQWSIKQEYEYPSQPVGYTSPPVRRGSVPHLSGYTPYTHPNPHPQPQTQPSNQTHQSYEQVAIKHEPERSATHDSGYGSFSPVDYGGGGHYPYQYPTQEMHHESPRSDSRYAAYTASPGGQAYGSASAPARTVSFSSQQAYDPQQGYDAQHQPQVAYDQQTYDQYQQAYHSPPTQPASGSMPQAQGQYPVGVASYEYGQGYTYSSEAELQQQRVQGQGDYRSYGSQY